MKTRLIRLMSLILLFSFPFYTISVYLNGNYHLLKNHTTNQCKEDIIDTLDISSGTINVLWYAIWGGASYDSGKGVAADTSGNIYCTGATYSYGAGDYDFTLVKYYSNGTKAWNTTWGGSSWEFGSGVAVDTSENIYCSGDTATFGGGMIPNFALVKFYPNGTKAWNTTWGWGGDSSDYCYGVAADTSGNVYCIGETYTSSMGRSYDLALVKFYSNGIKAWNTTWGGTDYDSGRAVAVDTSGNIYCTGETWSYGAGNYDFALVKFYPNETKAWNTTWGGSSYDYPYGVAVDTSGNVYVTGKTYSFGVAMYDFALVKFFPNGTKAWDTTWGGTDYDSGLAVAVDTSGNIYCTGETWSYGAGNYDFALVKFYPDGTKAWNTTWGGSSQDTGYGVTVDASGNVYCTGLTVSYDAGQNDLALVKFDANSPNMPINPSPQNGSTGVNINPLLSVDVWDPNNDLMNVSFYNKTDDSLIGMDINVSSGGSASINWTGLNWETTYEWYAVANDEMNSTRSLNWTFTTMDEPPPPIPGYKIIISAFSIIAVISLIIIGRTHKKLLQRNLNLK